MKSIILFVQVITLVNCAKILGVFYFPSISHQFVFQSIMKGLSEQGHEITFVTTDPLRDSSLVNFTEIDISEGYDMYQTFDASKFGRTLNVYQTTSMITEGAEVLIRIVMKNEHTQELLRKPSDAFDLILMEAHFPFFYGLLRKFRAPFISISSTNVFSYYHYLAGNSIHPVIYPDVLSEKYGKQYTLLDKFDSFYFTLAWAFMCEYLIFPRFNMLADEYFGHGVYLREIMRDSDLWMLNVNPIFSDRKPNVPNVIEFSNIHLKRNDSLSNVSGQN